MSIPESARGAILDAARLTTFSFDTPVNVLILYKEDGTEAARIDHWWSIRIFTGRGRNFDQDRVNVVEDGTALDTVLAASDTLRYQVETTPPTLSEVFQFRVAERPQAGRTREWALLLTTPKFKAKFFGARGMNR